MLRDSHLVKGDTWYLGQMPESEDPESGWYYVAFKAKGEKSVSWSSDNFQTMSKLLKVYPQVRGLTCQP